MTIWLKMPLMAPAGKAEQTGAGGGTEREETDELDEDEDAEGVDEEADPDGESEETDEEAEPPPAAAKGARAVSIPTSAISAIRREERARGEKRAKSLLEQRAKAAGFGSFDEMMQAAEKAKKAPARTRAAAGEAKPEQQVQSQEVENLRKEIAAAKARSQRLQQRAQMERKARRRAEQQRLAVEAEREISAAAVAAGVVDVDYAIALMKREVSGKPRSYLQQFNERDFFAKKLKKSHPFLFRAQETTPDEHQERAGREERKDASGGAGGQGGGQDEERETRQDPSPGTRQQSGGGPDQRQDARTMSREEYNKLLAHYKLTPPDGSLPI